MKQIENNPEIAVCGEWFTAYGTGENLGYVRDERNAKIMSKLRAVFAEWYDNGHVNEDDPNTCVLCIHLTNGVLFNNGTKYEIDFINLTA
jgi:general stress protein 26